MIAAITLKFLDPFGTGKLVLFQVTYDKVCNRVLVHAHSYLSHSDILIALRSLGLARTRVVIFLDSWGLWGRIDKERARH